MGFLGGLLKTVGGALPGIGTAVQIGSTVAGLVGGAKKGAKASKLRDQALQIANDRYAAGSPFRSKLATLAQRPTAQRPDMSALFADPGNPYSRQAPRPDFGQGMPPMSALAQQAGPPPMPARPKGPMGQIMGGRLFDQIVRR